MFSTCTSFMNENSLGPLIAWDPGRKLAFIDRQNTHLQDGCIQGIKLMAALEEVARIINLSLLLLEHCPGQVDVPRAGICLDALPEKIAHSARFPLFHHRAYKEFSMPDISGRNRGFRLRSLALLALVSRQGAPQHGKHK